MSKFSGREETKAESLLAKAADKLKGIIDTEMVVGKKISLGEVNIVPITKVSVGFVSGGGEYGNEEEEGFPFAGGTGAGCSLNPIGFLVESCGKVELIKVTSPDVFERLLEKVPEAIEVINKSLKGE